ncbi:uncharacterized protein LOC126550676 [Aphis gossypii]|uniref:uncharacterized protein LOC126550676 n=1 Tax=Aphis gossypii TaxID=80765 RepID=UPI00215911A9|nr:uncharacterized protein LOC126550676 [Aphis gossypii]
MSLEFNRPGGLCLEGNISENFKIFKQEVLIYFKATETNKKDMDVQVARLLNLLGHDGLKLYNTIKKEEQETVDTILQSLELYCIPKANEIIEHFNFFNRKQNEGEQFDIWYTDLKKLIKGCNFGEAENKILRTQIVLGIFDKETQTRLLRDDVALDKVVTYCQSIERAESNRRTLSSTKDVDKVVHGVGFKSKWRAKDMEKINNLNQNQWKGNTANDRQMETTEEKGNISININCNRCGLKHVYRDCPAYGKCCRNCSGYHHFAKMCKKKKQVDEKNKFKKAQEIRIDSIEEEESVFSIQSICTVYSIQNEWCKVFQVNGKNVNFKLDSGAEVNTLSEKDCEKLNLMKEIRKSNIVLEVYGGFKMKPIGVVKAILTLGDQNIETEFVVINKIYDSKSIIGLPVLKKFELLKNINVIDKDSNGLDINNFIEMNRDVFEGVGCFPDICKLTMKEGVTPKASIARRVPIKIKDKLKLKLDELVKKEIMHQQMNQVSG